jgi:hypothetical protein
MRYFRFKRSNRTLHQAQNFAGTSNDGNFGALPTELPALRPRGIRTPDLLFSKEVTVIYAKHAGILKHTMRACQENGYFAFGSTLRLEHRQLTNCPGCTHSCSFESHIPFAISNSLPFIAT